MNEGRIALRLLSPTGSELWRLASLVIGNRAEMTSEHERSIGVLCWERALPHEIGSLPHHRAQHDGPIVVLLDAMPAARGCRAILAKVEGAVLRQDFERALLATLMAVAVGQRSVPAAIKTVLERPPLSARERQVLAMLVLDFSNAEIANKLVVTEGNVKAHLTSAFQKLGVRSRSEAAELILSEESGFGVGVLRILPQSDTTPEQPPSLR